MQFAILYFVFLFALLGGYEMSNTTPSVWMVVWMVVVGGMGLRSAHKSIGPDGKIQWDSPRYEDKHMSVAWIQRQKRGVAEDSSGWKPGYPDVRD